MGSTLCSREAIEPELRFQPLEFAYDQDKYEARIKHNSDMICSNEAIENNITFCEQKLKKSERLYRDPTMNSQPIVLKDSNRPDFEVRCTFERPYIFLNEGITGRGRSYPIINPEGSKASQILVKDQLLQYFGAVLCFFAEHPHLAQQIILVGPNTYGINVLQLNVGSKKEFIYIDDYALCYNGRPLFSQPVKGTYMWPCLMERAWFKVKGNVIKKIEKTSPQEVVNTFLSYPFQKFILNSPDHTYNLLLVVKNLANGERKNGAIITTKKDPIHKIGLSGRKHFYLIKTLRYKDNNVYYLRNPCGLFDFRGIYSLIPEDLQKIILDETQDSQIYDGNFVLEEEEFLQQVEEFIIINYSEKSSIISEKAISVPLNEPTYLIASLKESGDISISYNQQGYKIKEETIFSPISYLVVEKATGEVVSEQNDHEGCFGVRSTNLLPGIYRKLKAGDYLIRIRRKNYLRGQVKGGSYSTDKIIVSAPFKVTFNPLDSERSMEQFNNFCKLRGRKEIQKRMSKSKRLKEDVEHAAFWVGDIAIIYVQKTSTSKPDVRVQVRLPDLKNLECTNQVLNKESTCLPAFQSDLLMIFEKTSLHEETILGKYLIQPINTAVILSSVSGCCFEGLPTTKRKENIDAFPQVGSLLEKSMFLIKKSSKEESMLEISNCYKLLRLDEDCSDLQLRRRFRKCAMATHPDRIKLSSTFMDIPEQAFVRFNEAYKRIVSYRKQLNNRNKESVNIKTNDIGSESNGLNLNEIRERLAKINAQMFSTNRDGPNSYGFNSEIDRIYEQHMNILDSLGDRLRQMRQK